MFEGFARVWTPVAVASKLRRKPMQVRVAGERIALFRKPDGAVSAVRDVCPHRGVALSLGEVTEDGCLECPFHGWQFRGDGQCAHVPLASARDEQRARFGVAAFPVREIGGLLWLFTGAHDDVREEPRPGEALADVTGRWTSSFRIVPWSTHWTRAMENMLDFPHLPWVHRGSIGRGLRKKLARSSVMATHWEPTEYGAEVFAELDGVDTGARLEWRRPNGMVLKIRTPLGLAHMSVYCVPVDETHVDMLVVSSRNFGRYNPLMWLGDLVNLRILFEDQAVLESSYPACVPHPSAEKSVAIDEPTLAFRQYFLKELANSSHAAGAAAPASAPGAKLVPAERLTSRTPN